MWDKYIFTPFLIEVGYYRQIDLTLSEQNDIF